ncbi:MAG: NAD(P)H-binding protein, partial [Pseudomonadota bacterium]
MSKTVIVLGAKGRFGRAASKAFSEAGWEVLAFARSWKKAGYAPYGKPVEGDAFDVRTLIAHTAGCDVIVNALNPPYQNWARDLPKLTAAVIEAAKINGGTVMVPGNVYNYGAEMPAVLSEATPHRPTSRKGRLRQDMEEAYAVAADDGVQTIILRAGDFLERETTGNWFDTYMIPKIT